MMQFHFFSDDTQYYYTFFFTKQWPTAVHVEYLSQHHCWHYSKHCSITSLPPLNVLEMIQFNHPTLPETSVPFLTALFLCSLMSVNQHHLRNISCVRKLSYSYSWIFKDYRDSRPIAFVSSKLDYCNSLFYNVPKYVLKKFQLVQTVATCLITCSRKYNLITLVLSNLQLYTGFL